MFKKQDKYNHSKRIVLTGSFSRNIGRAEPMSFGPKSLHKLLGRTYLHVDFDSFLERVVKEYSLGSVLSYAPILEGYEDANIHLSTKKGEFVLKIFAREKTIEQVQSYTSVLQAAKERNISMPVLLKGKQGYMSSFSDGTYTVHYFITHVFTGKNLESHTPTMSEIEDVTDVLAQFNSMDIPVADQYDSWGNKYIVKEYAKNEKQVPEDIKKLIYPVIQGMKALDTTSFSKAVIHADSQRKHILKSKKGEYCLLDLGCMRYDAKVFDLSIFLAWFCLGEDTWAKRQEIVGTVIKRYTKVHPLSKKELQSLPLLVRAAYAAYLLKTSVLIALGDTSDETREWYTSAKNMLKLLEGWDWKI